MKAMRPLLIGAGLLSVILFAMWIIPWFLASGRSSNVAHSPLIGLRMLAAAEEDFRNTDRDGNGVRDYWVGDVSGLYYLLDRDSPIKLIEPSMAARDEYPIRENAGKRTFLAAGFPPNDAWKYAVIPETPSGLPYGKDLDGDGLPY